MPGIGVFVFEVVVARLEGAEVGAGGVETGEFLESEAGLHPRKARQRAAEAMNCLRRRKDIDWSGGRNSTIGWREDEAKQRPAQVLVEGVPMVLVGNPFQIVVRFRA